MRSVSDRGPAGRLLLVLAFGRPPLSARSRTRDPAPPARGEVRARRTGDGAGRAVAGGSSLRRDLSRQASALLLGDRGDRRDAGRTPRRGDGPAAGGDRRPGEPRLHAPARRVAVRRARRSRQRGSPGDERPLLLVRAPGASRPVPDRWGDARLPRPLAELRGRWIAPSGLDRARVRGDGARGDEQGPPRPRAPAPGGRALSRGDRAAPRHPPATRPLARPPDLPRDRAGVVRARRRALRDRLSPRDHRAPADGALRAELGAPRALVPVFPRLHDRVPPLEPLRAGRHRARVAGLA